MDERLGSFRKMKKYLCYFNERKTKNERFKIVKFNLKRNDFNEQSFSEKMNEMMFL